MARRRAAELEAFRNHLDLAPLLPRLLIVPLVKTQPPLDEDWISLFDKLGDDFRRPSERGQVIRLHVACAAEAFLVCTSLHFHRRCDILPLEPIFEDIFGLQRFHVLFMLLVCLEPIATLWLENSISSPIAAVL